MSDITRERIEELASLLEDATKRTVQFAPHLSQFLARRQQALADLARTLLTRARIAERERDEARADEKRALESYSQQVDEGRAAYAALRAENEALRARVHSDICGNNCVVECGGKYAR